MKRFLSTLVNLSVVIVLLSGCISSQTPAPTPTHTPSPSPTREPTSTPEIDWFPPTPTHTPRPTAVLTATPELLAGLGETILVDEFEDGDAWTLGETPYGATSVLDGVLTIAISEDKAYLYSVRGLPILTDFYMEITASPALCSGQDEYGVLLRVDPNLNYYRFSLSCDGQVRLDRVYTSVSSPKPWYYSGAFPPGSPSINRLGIYMSGKVMHFYINQAYQFTINDPMIYSGSIGLFARSTGGHALTVNFYDLSVQAINEP